MTLCIHCALEEIVATNGYRQTAGPVTRGFFNESPEAHLARVHPDPIDPSARRALEQHAAEILGSGENSLTH
jgi:hypothetical protein